MQLQDPFFYLVDFDFADEGMIFAHGRPEHFCNSLRLNVRDFPTGSLRWVPYGRVYHNLGRVPCEPSINYLFHLPFCGSSLLTRYLERSSLMVRDPASLESLYIRSDGEGFPHGVPQLRRAALKLLSRRLDDRPVVVRTGGYYPEMIRQLVRPSTCRSALFLYADPAYYVAQVLKSQARRRHARLLFASRQTYVRARTGERLELLTDAEVVALSWCFAAGIVLEVAQRGRSPVRTLDCGELFARRDRTLASVCRSLGVEETGLSRARMRAIESTHAKLGHEFDGRRRRSETRRAAAAHDGEIRAAQTLLEKLDPGGALLAGLRSLSL